MYESSEILNEQATKDNQPDSNVCIVTQRQIIIQFNGFKFHVSRQIKSIEDIIFAKCDSKIDEMNQEQIIERFQFVCIYGMLQLSKTPVFIFVLETQQVGNINKNAINQAKNFKVIKVKSNEEEPFLSSLQRSFSLFKFYNCPSYDLSKRLQSQFDTSSYSQQEYFSNFVHTLHYGTFPSELLTVFINGFVKTEEMQMNDKKIRITIVSRGDYHRLGRRWLRRGIDQKGYVANKYQTETIVQIINAERHEVFSYVQLRGSIPLFWQQFPCFQFKASLRICQEGSRNEKYLKYYLNTLIQRYKNVVMLNLVNKTGRQGQIGSAFRACFDRVDQQDTNFIWFDYAAQYQRKQQIAFQELLGELKQDVIGNYFFISASKNRQFEVERQQNKVIRTNCMDCLDRTNYIQSIISKVVCIQLETLISGREINQAQSLKFQCQQFQKMFKRLWKANGIAISRQYSGTSTMKNDFADYGKRTLGGMFGDFCIGMHRFYLGHFVDYYNQNCIDLHFGRIKFEQDGSQFKGLWWKRIFKWFAFSGVFLIPLLLSQKITEIYTKKIQQNAAYGGAFFLGLILGGIIFKMGGRAVIQQPISRRYELIQ